MKSASTPKNTQKVVGLATSQITAANVMSRIPMAGTVPPPRLRERDRLRIPARFDVMEH